MRSIYWTDLWLGANNFFFSSLSPPWFSSMTFQIFKATLQFVILSDFILFLLITIVLSEIIYEIKIFFNFILLWFSHLSDLVFIFLITICFILNPFLYWFFFNFISQHWFHFFYIKYDLYVFYCYLFCWSRILLHDFFLFIFFYEVIITQDRSHEFERLAWVELGLFFRSFLTFIFF